MQTRTPHADLTKTAIGYVRVSTQEQAKEGVSLDAQRDKLRAYCKVNDIKLVDIVAEGFDAGVRYEENLARDMIAVSLGPPQRFVLVASPEFLEAHGRSGVPLYLWYAPGKEAQELPQVLTPGLLAGLAG